MSASTQGINIVKYTYMVMDSRAQFDTDAATVLECCSGNKQPSMKSLGKFWGQQGAVLVRYNTTTDAQGHNVLDNETIIGVIP